jgi:hypothetical protein
MNFFCSGCLLSGLAPWCVRTLNFKILVMLLVLHASYTGILKMPGQAKARGNKKSFSVNTKSSSPSYSKSASPSSNPSASPSASPSVAPSASQLSVSSCVWTPNKISYERTECMNVISDNILASASRAPSNENSENVAAAPRRWLFFGDSTTWRLFRSSPVKDLFGPSAGAAINKACPLQYTCYKHIHERCHLNEAFHLTPRNEWVPPDLSLGEGPVKNGLIHQSCQDCKGCNSTYSLCKKNMAAAPSSCINSLAYGGYFSVEFARDVELQTPQFNTTQENVAAFIEKQFNSPSHKEDFGGAPNCVVSAGFHDMVIANITLPIYLSNVRWYLQLLKAQCTHIIWLQNTAPLIQQKGNYSQTAQRTKIWNQGVYNMLVRSNNTELKHHLTVMDVFEASQNYSHADNVHMAPAWYKELGKFFVQVTQNISSYGPEI